MNRGRPYIEYTRNAEDDVSGTPSSAGMPPVNLLLQSAGQPQVKRAVARKSTTATKKNEPSKSKPDPDRVRWESKGSVKPLDVDCAESCKFAKHQCTPLVSGLRVLSARGRL